MRSHRTLSFDAARRGFTIVELLVALVMGVIILSAATKFAVSSWQGRRSWTLRESVDRNARFLGIAIARDAAEAGVSIESTPVFGTLGTFTDTISILSVPFEPNEAPVYRFDAMDGDTINPLPPGGNCGSTCLSFLKHDGTFDLQAGDLARLQIGGERRLLLLTAVNDLGGANFSVEFLPVTSLLGRPAGLDDSLPIDRYGTAIQKLRAVTYWHDPTAKAVFRSERLNPTTGRPVGQQLADGVEAWEARLLFEDGFEAPRYDGMDTDSLNDAHRILGVKVRAKVMASRTDPAVNGGAPVYRWYEWRAAPRNLLYEKNRL